MAISRQSGSATASPAPARAPALGHVRALDGLRGLAFLIVLGCHLPSVAIPHAGYVGVDLFFGLSGFLITVLLVEERRRTGTVSLRRFALRRARRLLPALVTFLLAYLLLDALFGSQSWFNGVPGITRPGDPLPVTAVLRAAAGILTYLFDLAISFRWHWGTGAPVGHLWSLAVEGQFYAVWGVVLAAVLALGAWRARRQGHGPSRPGRASPVAGLGFAGWAAFGLAVLSVAATAVVWPHDGGQRFVYFASWTRAQGLFLGAVAGLWWAQGGVHRLAASSLGRFLTALAVGVTGGWVVAGLWDLPLGGPPAAAVAGLAGLSVACAAVVVLVAARPWSALARAASVPWLCYVGRRSYALYLWHYVLIAWFRFDGVAGEAVAVALAFGLAEASWRLVEQPVLARGRVGARRAHRSGTAPDRVPVAAMAASRASELPGGARSAGDPTAHPLR